MGFNISIKNMRCSYGYEGSEEILVISGFEVALCGGNIYWVAGDNGSGKSTFLKALLGLVPLQAGQATVHRQGGVEEPFFDVSALSSRLRSLFYMPQQTHTMFPVQTCVYTFLRYVAQHTYDIEQMCEKYRYLRELLKEIQWRHVDHVSGGQRQLIALMSMHLCKAEVALLDEPTSAISVENRNNALQLIEDYRDNDRIVLVAAHRFDDLNATKITIPTQV